MEGQISYTVARIAATLDRDLTGDAAERWASWRVRYFPEVNKLVRAMRIASVADANRRGAEVTAQIDPVLPDDHKSESLSRKALWIVASTPGVTCVLNGMRTVEYVQDALGIMEWEPLDGVERVYEAVRKEHGDPFS